MKQYTIKITVDANSDMEDIYEYIAIQLQSPENALGQYSRIADQILKLKNMAERYRLMDSEPEHSRGLRLMPVDNYSVIYVVEGQVATVTNVLYSGSDIHKRLMGD